MICAHGHDCECTQLDGLTTPLTWTCPVLAKRMTRHWTELCRTDSGYFAHWKYGPSIGTKKVAPEGPGSTLFRILRRGIPVLGRSFQIDLLKHCGCGCGYKTYANKMNRWGVSGCHIRLDEIVAYMRAEAVDVLGVPFCERAARVLVRWAINRAAHLRRVKPI